MNEAEFDVYAEEYYQLLRTNINKSGEDSEFLRNTKLRMYTMCAIS